MKAKEAREIALKAQSERRREAIIPESDKLYNECINDIISAAKESCFSLSKSIRYPYRFANEVVEIVRIKLISDGYDVYIIQGNRYYSINISWK